MAIHQYQTRVEWTGNRGAGTLDYRAYGREHEITAAAKSMTIPGSSDPAFRGDPVRYNPEELLVASLSACHMLWYLHLCAVNEVVVLEYVDAAEGEMREGADGRTGFTHVTLRPRIRLANASMRQRAEELHALANEKCFIANSVNFPVGHESEFIIPEVV